LRVCQARRVRRHVVVPHAERATPHGARAGATLRGGALLPQGGARAFLCGVTTPRRPFLALRQASAAAAQPTYRNSLSAHVVHSDEPVLANRRSPTFKWTGFCLRTEHRPIHAGCVA